MNEANLQSTTPNRLVWTLGVPMIISMVLQALYNIVDTAFVINMDPVLGAKANLALTYAFPIQIFMIALGVGTGIGINALLSRYLGEKNQRGIQKTVANSLFLMVAIYALFVLIGIFLSRPFIAMQNGGDEEVVSMGERYVFIVCVFSLGNVGFTVFERFLQSTGKTSLSMVSQVSGAVTNIVLDYVFIYPCGWGIEGAAYATVIGQFVAFALALVFQVYWNKAIRFSLRKFSIDGEVIAAIYKVGWSAAVMQALLSVMMLGMNLIFKLSAYDAELLQGSYGIYYKIQQIPLFACFGMSNALITLTSYTYGLGDLKRLREIRKWGIVDTMVVAIVITALFEATARPLAGLFGLAGGGASEEIVATCAMAIRIASTSYLFMAFSVASQGVMQGLRHAFRPLLLSLLRLVVLVFPIAYLFTRSPEAKNLVWVTFIIAEALTAVVAFSLNKGVMDEAARSLCLDQEA